ncbi:MFS family permease [Microbacteriaceae bacterium SG_E_30_P1]|uniref:MFS family permease n=1 Tax=Antiquaquibacter oligotrophicus TaxID=2880260 RepID=A0ABT6KPK7_9MICO|nr:MFS transporter [Antiquaquibacter oligotrophicus]MDH6181789.1 MFS family permease [Antiquaquibacter oligotrophicus]UDF12531.1 MFS transporter [Antiquaquibacter oligotrophicus]
MTATPPQGPESARPPAPPVDLPPPPGAATPTPTGRGRRAATFTPFAEPTRRVHAGWIALFATAWFGIWMAQLTPIQLLLPQQVDTVLNPTDWTESVVAFGIISGIAGACALIAYPLTGALSDRTTSRFGRRRPWILAGALVFAVALVLLGIQTTMVGIGVAWSIAIIGFCMLSAALTATISDQVPVGQRGFVSGWVSAPQAVGTVLGLLLVILLGLTPFLGYTLMAVLLVVLVLPFLAFVPDEVLPRVLRPPFTLAALVRGFWVNPVKYPDFGWTLVSRILVNIGNALGTTLLLYFIMFGLGREETAEDDLLSLTLVYLVFFILAALGFGKLSDVIGRRKPFVYVAAYLQGLAALIIAFVPDLAVTFVAAALLGIGYGCFMAVDQALATQVLPNSHTRGKDLGIMNIATTVPQAVAPLVGAFIVAYLGGFMGLFIVSAAAAAVGGLAILPVRGVR